MSYTPPGLSEPVVLTGAYSAPALSVPVVTCQDVPVQSQASVVGLSIGPVGQSVSELRQLELALGLSHSPLGSSLVGLLVGQLATGLSPSPLGVSSAFATYRRHFVSGVVTDINGAPCARHICLVRRPSGSNVVEVVSIGTSDSITGEYFLEVPDGAEVLRIVFDDAAEPLLHDIADRVIPG